MTVFEVGQYINTIFGTVLIIRLISTGLVHTYLAFFCFLLFDLFQAFAFLFISDRLWLHVDYRVMWISFRVVSMGLMCWMVYALLTSVLQSLPGILKLSRKLLFIVFVVAIAMGAFTIVPEYTASGAGNIGSLVKQSTLLTLVVERAVTMSAFISLLAILVSFVLWFPVEIPRNLVMFSVGLVIYSGAKTALLLARTYYPHAAQDVYDRINLVYSAVLAVCFLCWAIIVNKAGQHSNVRIGHSWKVQDQERLVLQLDTMNSTLLRARQ